MFHIPLRIPWRISTRPVHQLAIHRSNLAQVYKAASYSTLSVPHVRDELASIHSPVQSAEVNEIWQNSVIRDSQAALDLRYEFYQKIRELGLQYEGSKWSFAILGSIPREKVRFADILFATELLLAQSDWTALKSLLVHLSVRDAVFWEQMTLLALDRECPRIPLETCLQILGESCVNQGIDLRVVTREDNLPLMRMLQIISARYKEPDELLLGVKSVANTNMLMAASLCSALLRAESYALIDNIRPQSPMETDVRSSAALATSDALWKWKAMMNVATPDDLRLEMMCLIYRRRSTAALELYDRHPQLHDTLVLNEPVLLAAAGIADYARLQAVFEFVEQDAQLVKQLGSRRYAIVLSALSYLGDAGVVNGIYDHLLNTQPDLLTRGVFHALIHSHGIRGDLVNCRKYYDIMMARGISPTYTTFDLVLQAYRDATDLKGALVFIGDEMISRHQFGLRNQEFTALLSLCGKRRDFKSAKYIWDWGRSLVNPDRLTYNAYLHALISANMFPDASALFGEMEENKMVAIDTLTIMLNAAGRSKRLLEYTIEFTKKKELLGLTGDSGWYMSLLSALSEHGNIRQFEEFMDEMKTANVPLNASHYALYMQLVSKTKQTSKQDKIFKQMQKSTIPINFAYIDKHFRNLVGPGSSQRSRQLAHTSAQKLLEDGLFDPTSAMVPRGAVPARVIKPIVRMLIKSGQHVSAKQLLDSLRKQRVDFSDIRDEYMIWELYMEVAEASKNYGVIDKLWSEFVRTLPAIFTLAEEARLQDDTSATPKGSSPNHTKPIFKVAKRYRNVFWKTVDIRIRYLQQSREKSKLLELPHVLDQLGVAMTGHNINTFIVALVDLGEAEQAFSLAVSANFQKTFNLSKPARAALISAVDKVKYHKYGGLGYKIRNLAKHSPK